MSAERITYLDSSAIVKLIMHESESDALRQFLRRQRPLASSALARVEVSRAVLHLGPKALRTASDTLSRIDLIRVSERILAHAGTLEPAEIRTLDAIHLASASLLNDSLDEFVCYDKRLSRAAAARGWTVRSPS